MHRMRILIVAAAAFVLGATGAAASGGDLPEREWSFDGVFGTYDKAQLQRGFQVYTEVCAGCHSLRFVAFRNLAALGYSEDAIKAYAANHEVQDGPNDEGEMFTRPAIPSDRFVPPFANENAARASNNGAYPPDLSLITKARKGGANYLFAILTGYAEEAPADVELMEGMNYHKYFLGNQIAMAAPLYGDDVEYADGTEATLEQEAADVTAFLAWAAEPEMEQRKSMGIGVLAFLGILFVMVAAVKREVWKNVKKH